jgi:hypothetical protein
LHLLAKDSAEIFFGRVNARSIWQVAILTDLHRGRFLLASLFVDHREPEAIDPDCSISMLADLVVECSREKLAFCEDL